MSDPTNNVSPQSHDFANIGTYMANVENRISSLDRAVTDEVKKLVSYVRGLDENVEAAKYGKYRGNDDNAKLYASEITELKEEKKKWTSILQGLPEVMAAQQQRPVDDQIPAQVVAAARPGSLPEALWQRVNQLPRYLFDERLYAQKQSASSKGSSSSKRTPVDDKNAKKFSDAKCVMCGTCTNITGSHILKNESHAKILRIAFQSWCNVLPLCGTKTKKGSCHYLFDSLLAGFYKTDNKWWVISREGKTNEAYFGRPDDYHTRSLHTHLAACLTNPKFVFSQTGNGEGLVQNRVWEWIQSLPNLTVSPDRQDRECFGHHSRISQARKSLPSNQGLTIDPEGTTNTSPTHSPASTPGRRHFLKPDSVGALLQHNQASREGLNPKANLFFPGSGVQSF